jgi:hypothetical protein
MLLLHTSLVLFLGKGLEMRDVHFGTGPKVYCWKGFGMGMLLSMDSCPCELSRAGRSFGICTVVTWRSCNFVYFTFLTQTPSQIQEHLRYCCAVLSL